jgi:hypothetical protein
MRGTQTPARIFFKARAASLSGTASRTISHPAFSSRLICATVDRTSRLSVFVIDWTAMGEPPPTGTPPTMTRLVFLRGNGGLSGKTQDSTPFLS